MQNLELEAVALNQAASKAQLNLLAALSQDLSVHQKAQVPVHQSLPREDLNPVALVHQSHLQEAVRNHLPATAAEVEAKEVFCQYLSLSPGVRTGTMAVASIWAPV